MKRWIAIPLMVATACACGANDDGATERATSNQEPITLRPHAAPELISSQIGVVGWTLDNGTLFFTGVIRGETSYSVGSLSVTGNAPVHLASEPQRPWLLTTDAQHVYWGDEGSLQSISKSGGSPATLWAASSAEVIQVAVDASTAFFTSVEPGSVSRLQRVPLAGGASQILYEDDVFDDSLSAPSLGLDDKNVYLAHNHDFLSIPKSGGSPVTVATFDEQPCNIRYEAGGDAYVNVNNTIWRVPLTGGTPVRLFDGTVGGQSVYGCLNLATDATHVYFTAYTDPFTVSGIYELPKAGGPAVQIAANQQNLTALAIDDTYVYWNLTDGSVYRLAK